MEDINIFILWTLCASVVSNILFAIFLSAKDDDFKEEKAIRINLEAGDNYYRGLCQGRKKVIKKQEEENRRLGDIAFQLLIKKIELEKKLEKCYNKRQQNR